MMLLLFFKQTKQTHFSETMTLVILIACILIFAMALYLKLNGLLHL